MIPFTKAIASAVLGASLTFTSLSNAAPLKIDAFNPGSKSIFPVTSTLIMGPSEALLIDAQFQRDDAQTLLKMIRDSGKDLKTIYISHGDPDFYFGLDVITDAYPDAKVLASPTTLAHITKTIDRKVSYWGPILGKNAPQKIIVPEVIKGNSLSVDGERLEIIGLNGHDPKHTFVWMPSVKTIAGGVNIFEGMHVWMADTQTPESRAKWLKNLDDMLALNPNRIIPGHVMGKSNENVQSIAFTRTYVSLFETEAAKASNSAELIQAMKSHYPDFTNNLVLELSAKVLKGEMQWP